MTLFCTPLDTTSGGVLTSQSTCPDMFPASYVSVGGLAYCSGVLPPLVIR